MSKTNYWDQIEEAFEAVDIYETYDVFKQGSSQVSRVEDRYPGGALDDERDRQRRAQAVF